MTRKRRRRKVATLVPRLGPATNLRPAGAHESAKRYNRKKLKIALEKELEGDFVSGNTKEAAIAPRFRRRAAADVRKHPAALGRATELALTIATTDLTRRAALDAKAGLTACLPVGTAISALLAAVLPTVTALAGAAD